MIIKMYGKIKNKGSEEFNKSKFTICEERERIQFRNYFLIQSESSKL